MAGAPDSPVHTPIEPNASPPGRAKSAAGTAAKYALFLMTAVLSLWAVFIDPPSSYWSSEWFLLGTVAPSVALGAVGGAYVWLGGKLPRFEKFRALPEGLRRAVWLLAWGILVAWAATRPRPAIGASLLMLACTSTLLVPQWKSVRWTGRLAAMGLLFLLFMEGAARLDRDAVAETQLGRIYARLYGRSPGLKLYGLDVLLNEYGFRDYAHLDEYLAPRTVVLALGDSFTYGPNIFDSQSLWPKVLERNIENRISRPVTVINAGGVGLEIRDYLHSLTDAWTNVRTGAAVERGMLELFTPDLVVVGLNLNDINYPDAYREIGTYAAFQIEELLPAIPWARALSPLDLHVMMIRLYKTLEWHGYPWLIGRTSEILRRTGVIPPTAEALLDTLYANPRLWNTYRATWREIVSATSRRHIPLLVVLLPESIGTDDLSRYPFHSIHRQIGRFFRDEPTANVTFIDLLEPVHNWLAANHMKIEDAWVTKRDRHPNAALHEVYAHAMAPAAARLLKGN